MLPPFPVTGRVSVARRVDCSPSLDQVAGLFPASSGQRGPYATDRSISSIEGADISCLEILPMNSIQK
jgi:hypothetical protein